MQSIRASLRSRADDRAPIRWRWLRLAVQLAFLSLFVIWAFDPASPATVFAFVAPVCAVVAFLWARFVTRSRASGQRGGSSRVIRIVDVLLTNLILILVGSEIAVRVLGSVSDSIVLMPFDAPSMRRIREFRGVPNAAHCGAPFNALGYYDEPFVEARKPGVRRIVALADSFGVGVVRYEDNFLTRVDRKLADTEVLNFGVVGLGPRDYLYLYNTEAARYEPDVVLVCIFIGNDLADHRARVPALHRKWFRLPQVIRRLRVMYREPRESVGFAGGPTDGATFGEAEYLALEKRRAASCLTPMSVRVKDSVALAERWLTDLHEAAGDRLCVVVIPDEFQVNDDLWRRIDLPGSADRERLNRLLAAFFGRRGIPFLDLLPVLRAAEPSGRTYKPRDTHWNERGNTIAADAIASWLERRTKTRGG